MKFTYRSGQDVAIGDRVRTVGGRNGVVQEILYPGTATAKEFLCPKGGVVITEDWDGVPSPRVIQVPGGMDWDDVELLERQDGGD